MNEDVKLVFGLDEDESFNNIQKQLANLVSKIENSEVTKIQFKISENSLNEMKLQLQNIGSITTNINSDKGSKRKPRSVKTDLRDFVPSISTTSMQQGTAEKVKAQVEGIRKINLQKEQAAMYQKQEAAHRADQAKYKADAVMHKKQEAAHRADQAKYKADQAKYKAEKAKISLNDTQERSENAKKTSGTSRENKSNSMYMKFDDELKKYKDSFKNFPELRKEGESLRDAFGKGEFKDLPIQEQQKLFSEWSKKVKETGVETESLGIKLKKLFNEHFSTAVALVGVHALRQGLSEVYQNVIKLDSAVTDLQIATGYDRNQTKELVSEYSNLGKELGATTTEVAESADTWLRQGYSIEEANELIKNSTMLSKLGQMESADASTALTSALRGYQLTASDSINVVDKLVSVDMKAAASAGGIATAMAECANSARVAGVSMDDLIGYLTIVKEVTQDGDESVGTFAKTLFARMGNVKAGRLSDPETGEDLSDVETTLSGMGIKLRENNQEFRNFSEVLKEVGSNWDNYSSVQQHAIAGAFAGTRQQEKFLVLMENFDTAMNYSAIATNSAGTALDKYSNSYLKSVEAAQNRATASFEAFSATLLDGGVVSDVFNFGSGLVDFVNIFVKAIGVVGGLRTVLNLLIPTLVAINAHHIVSVFSKVVTLGPKIKNVVGNVIKGFEQIPKLFKNLGSIMDDYQSNLKEGTSSTKAFGDAVEKAGLSANAIKASIGAITLAITVITSIVSYFAQKQEEARQAAADAASEINEYNQTLSEYKGTIDELRKELDAGNLSENEAYEARKKLLEIEDSLIEKFGDEAKSINLVTGEIEEQIGKIDDLSRLKYDEWVKQHGNEGRKAADIFANTSRSTVDLGGVIYDSATVQGGSEMWGGYLPDFVKGMTVGEFSDLKKQILNEFDKILPSGTITESSLPYISRDFFISDSDISNIYEAKEVYSKLHDKLLEIGKAKWGEDYNTYIGDTLTKYNDIISKIQKVIDDNEETFNTYVSGQLMDSNIYGDIYPNALAAQKAYNDAILDGDDKAAQDAVEKMKEVEEKFAKAGWSDEAVSMYMQDFFDKFDSNTKNKTLEIKAKITTEQDLSTTVSDFKTASDSFEKLGNALNDFESNGNVLIGTISEIKEAFKDMPNIEDYIRNIGSANNIDSLKQSLSGLAKEYINQKGLLKGVSEENKKFVTSQLEAIGVLNAEEVAEQAVTATKFNNAMAGENLTNITTGEYIALVKKYGGTVSAAEAMKNLELQKKLAKTSNLSSITSKEAGAMATLAANTGLAADKVKYFSKLKEALEAKESVEKAKSNKKKFGPYLPDSYYDAEIKKWQDKINNLNPNDYVDDFDIPDPNIDASKFPSDKSSSKTAGEKASDKWKEYLRKQKHYLEMGEISEKEYYKRLNANYKKYLGNYSETQDERFSFEEEYYDWKREQVKEELNTKKHQLEMGKISEKQYYDWLVGTYKKKLQKYSETTDDIRSIDKEYYDWKKEQEKKNLENVKNALDSTKDAVDTLVDEQIETLERQKESIEESYNAEIDKLQEKIDKLQKANEEREEEINLAEKAEKLAKARQNRTILTYDSLMGWTYISNKEDVKEAQEEYRQALFDKQINDLEADIEILEQARDDATSAIETQIDALSEYKELWSDVVDLQQKSQNIMFANQIFGNSWQNDILAQNINILKNFLNQYNVNAKSTDLYNLKYNESDLTKKQINDKYEILDSQKINLAGYQLSLDKVTEALTKTYVPETLKGIATKNVVTNTIGNIIIQKPIGNVDSLAKEIQTKLPNAILQQINK